MHEDIMGLFHEVREDEHPSNKAEFVQSHPEEEKDIANKTPTEEG